MSSKEEIIKYYKQGFSTAEIEEVGIKNRIGNPISRRHIQRTIKEYIGDTRGRTNNVAIFTLDDMYIIAEDPGLLNELAKKRFRDYYKGVCNKKQVLPLLQLRVKVLERDDYLCTRCGDYKNLECHHFQNNDSEDPDDCITLCRRCHMEEHSKTI